MNEPIVEPPDNIKLIFAKPGLGWTPDECKRVREWLAGESGQLLKIVRSTIRELEGEDGMEVWHTFFSDKSDKPDKKVGIEYVIAKYDPTKPNSLRFEGWLAYCFRQYCHDVGIRNDRRRTREGVSLDSLLEIEKDVATTGIADSVESDVLTKVQIEAMLSKLPERERRLIRLRFLDGLTYQEIAKRESAPLGSVKAWIFRGLHLLREEKKDWQ